LDLQVPRRSPLLKKIFHVLTYGSCNCQVYLLSGFGARTYYVGDRDLAEEYQKEQKAVNGSKITLQIPLCTVIVLTFKKNKKCANGSRIF